MSRSSILHSFISRTGTRLTTQQAPRISTRALSAQSKRQVRNIAAANQILSRIRESSRQQSNHPRQISTSSHVQKGLSPDTEDPQPKKAEDISISSEPVELTEEKYHEVSDLYIDSLVAKLEELQEGRDDVDVEYSAGVLTVVFPPNGTYVINKQPPNKQIWLSSPISGPKRYDYVVVGEGQHEKEGSGSGDWVYARDGTTLSQVVLKELGVDIHAIDIEG